MVRLRELYVMVIYGRACRTFVNRVWKEGNRMSVPLDTVLATARSASELRPDFEGGSNLARWLPELFCREGMCCFERSTGDRKSVV